MRRILLAVAALLLCLPVWSEAHEGIGYQRTISLATESRTQPVIAMDVCSSNPCGAFVGSAVSSGTNSFTVFPGEASHPGVVQLSSAAGADSGYTWYLSLTPFLLAGGETFEASFQVVALTNLTLRLGFGDATSVTAPVDGVYLDIAATGVATGTARSNNSASTTVSTYTVEIGTWYRISVSVETATLARFTLYSGAGAVLWTDTVATNIPTGAGRNTGAQAIATRSDGGTAALVALDYMAVYFERDLVR